MLYMLDTNIISYFAEGNQNVILNLEKQVLAENEIGISIVAYYEVERGLKYINAVHKLNDFYQFVFQLPQHLRQARQVYFEYLLNKPAYHLLFSCFHLLAFYL